MEWLMMNPDVQGAFSSLGSQVGETYVASPNCLDILNEMVQKMSVEDRTLRTLRRAIGSSQIVKKDLLPILMHMKNDRKITDTTIKVLADLTTPVECLLPIELMSKSEAGRNTIIELNWLLVSCKETFLDPRGTRRIIDHIRDILYKGDKLDERDCETLNDCVILLRNVLHLPDSMLCVAEGFLEQNQILWNLFAHSFDKILIEMMTCPRRKEWRIAMAQLVVLLYKDQRVATLQKLLNLWMESGELSESSEDNESNTSPPEGESFSSMVTSDPTSDSSDNSGSDRRPEIKFLGKRKPSLKQLHIKKDGKQGSWLIKASEADKKVDSSSSKLSDCGYSTQAENQESISSSSYEDERIDRNMKPVHHKPSNIIKKRRYSNGKMHLTTQEKEDLIRKKILRRFRSNIVNMKALLHHKPSKEDISHLLKEFTVDFLIKAYDLLILELWPQLVMDSSLDRTHFSWLIAYFLKFAVQLELDLQHVRGVLTFDIISFLAYEGACLCEQYEILSSQQECDLSTNLRKIHLITTAIREILQTVMSYKKMKCLSESDKMHLNTLQKNIAESEDLRCLFVVLLRQFNPQVHSKQYLQDLIVTNHILLTFIENSLPDATKVLQAHMKQFVAVEIMRQYGYLLEHYKENSHFVNNCVFTMMHHVAGDLEHVTALFQPTILKTFSIIWESGFEICDDWSDLIEYVIHKFLNTPRSLPSVLESKEKAVTTSQADGWTREESDCLYWYYVQSVNSPDPVGNVIDLYAKSGIVNKSRLGVIEQLLRQDAINSAQYNELMKKEQVPTNDRLERIEVDQKPKDEIDLLKDILLKEETLGSQYILWLQKVLLETCYAKMFQNKRKDHIIEPIPYNCSVLNEPVPIVPWSCEQQSIMQSPTFLLLLHKLGLLLPADIGKMFARIPSTWNSKTLYARALHLGPIQKDWVKFKIFSIDCFEEFDECIQNQFEA